MANPMEFAAGSSDDIKNFEDFFSNVGGSVVAESLEKLAAGKSRKMKFAWHGKNADRAKASITLRLTPEIHKKWLKVVDEFSDAKTALSPEFRKRASGEFAAAFKDGNIVIEVKEKIGKKTKRTAFASKRTAQNIRDGIFKLSRKDGQTKDYDAIKVIEHDDFKSIAQSFITSIKTFEEPTADVTSESIEAANEENHVEAPITNPPTEVAVKSASKKGAASGANKPLTEKSTASQEAQLLKEQEEALEAERELLRKKKAEEQEALKEKNKIEHEEEKLTESKEETLKGEVGTISAEHAVESSEQKKVESTQEVSQSEQTQKEETLKEVQSETTIQESKEQPAVVQPESSETKEEALQKEVAAIAAGVKPESTEQKTTAESQEAVKEAAVTQEAVTQEETKQEVQSEAAIQQSKEQPAVVQPETSETKEEALQKEVAAIAAGVKPESTEQKTTPEPEASAAEPTEDEDQGPLVPS